MYQQTQTSCVASLSCGAAIENESQSAIGKKQTCRPDRILVSRDGDMKCECLNPVCGKAFFSRTRLQVFCSAECRKQGSVNFNKGQEVPDPVEYLNQLGFSNGAAFVRLGTRIKAEIRYFPSDGAKLPLSVLPALPLSGSYVVQLFDAMCNTIHMEQSVIVITESFIKNYCRFHTGARGRLIPGTEP